MKNWLKSLQHSIQSLWASPLFYQRLDVAQHRLLLAIILIINLWVVYQLLRPATATERQVIAAYQTQGIYPRSRELAHYLTTHQQDFNRFAYFKFLRILAAEQRALKVAPEISYRTRRYQPPQ